MSPDFSPFRPWMFLGFPALVLIYLNLPNGVTPVSFKRDCTAAIQGKLADWPADTYAIEGQVKKRLLMRDYAMNFRVRNETTGAVVGQGRCIVAKDSRAGDRTVLYRYVPQSP